MKRDYPQKGIKELCVLFGKTRAAYYDWQKRNKQATLLEGLAVEMVHKVRKDLPKAGVRQLHQIFERDYQLEIGRDYLFDLLKQYNLLIRQRKRKIVTTNSRHWLFKYPNLIQNLVVMRPEEVWVSDITYIRLANGFAYLSLITDAYSRKIVGYCLHPDLSKEGCIKALKMALRQRSTPHKQLIHHSDRGGQYASQEYVNLLTDHDINISMTQKKDPYENALAERMNGIVKNEFNIGYTNLGFDATQVALDKAVQAYNTIRRHSSCDYLTPAEAHQKEGALKKHWKNYYKSKGLSPKFEQTDLLSSLRITELTCQTEPGFIL